MKKKGSLKQREWLKHFLNRENPVTFLNQKQSAIAAGYRCKNNSVAEVKGAQLAKSWKPEIEKWLTEDGLTEAVLKQKMIELLDAKDKKFLVHASGAVITEKVVPNTAVQLGAVRVAAKCLGMEAPVKSEVKLDGNLEYKPLITPDMSAKEAAEIYNRFIRGGKK